MKKQVWKTTNKDEIHYLIVNETYIYVKWRKESWLLIRSQLFEVISKKK